MSHDTDQKMLELAARTALRGHGGAEPNPLVGCVIANSSGEIVGIGHHTRCGGPHAERVALALAGPRARGARAYVTLEPCAHQGRTPPCTEGLIEAGIASVVFAARDPNPEASGGAAALRDAGIEVVERTDIRAANHLNRPFLHRVNTGLPWVTAKWAQTLDGRIATASGDSKWISGAPSRRLVHRERGRVDAILTGIGTVLADDPRLDAREVRRRRVAARVIIDPSLDLPLDSKLVAMANDLPLIVATDEPDSNGASNLRDRGAVLVSLDEGLKGVLRLLSADHNVANVLVEAGGGLLGKLFEARLVNAALVFTAPILLGDRDAPGAARGLQPSHIADGIAFEPIWTGRRGLDQVGWYHVS